MRFEYAVEIILKHEGGYVDHPNDPGGETNFGISKRSYPNENMKTMTRERAIEIYKRDFWDEMQCDDLPAVLRLAVFDCAVNQGPFNARRFMQQALRVSVDGVWGQQTWGAIRSHNPQRLLERFLRKRADHYFRNKNFNHFGRGWMVRLVDIAAKTKTKV